MVRQTENALTDQGDRIQAHDPSGQALDLAGLDQRSRDDLYDLAKRLHIDGRCRMTRDQLIDAIRSHS